MAMLLLFTNLAFSAPVNKKNKFQIEGVKGVLLKNVNTRLSELAKEKLLDQLSEDELQQHIKEALQPYGYFKPSMAFKHHPLRIVISPGPLLRISSLNIEVQGEGRSNLKINELLADLPLHPGDPLNSVKYEQIKQDFLTTAEHQGYLHAVFDKSEILVDELQYRAALTLIFNTHQQYYFGQISFDPTYISPELLQRYIKFKPRQPYSTDAVLALNNDLLASGYFSAVSVKAQSETLRDLPLTVHLQPAKRINYSYGIGYGTDTGPRGRLGYHVVPVNRYGHKFNAVALASLKESALQAQYSIPGRNPIQDQYNITGNLANLNYGSGNSTNFLLALAQQHNQSNFQRTLSLNGLTERFKYTQQPREDKTTLFPKASFTWLQTSDKLFSPNGYNVTLTGLGASKAFLSKVNFTQGSINAKAAVTVPALSTRFYFHTIQGINQIYDINQMPLSLAFLLGGADNLKGYSYNSIGPGKILSYGGIEIQKETVEHWYLVSFLDSGDVYSPNIKNLKNDIGLGLMWVSPVGPIKIGVAQAIDSKFSRWQDRKPRLVINMGPDL